MSNFATSVVVSAGQICKWYHLMAKFETNVNRAMCLLSHRVNFCVRCASGNVNLYECQLQSSATYRGSALLCQQTNTKDIAGQSAKHDGDYDYHDDEKDHLNRVYDDDNAVYDDDEEDDCVAVSDDDEEDVVDYDVCFNPNPRRNSFPRAVLGGNLERSADEASTRSTLPHCKQLDVKQQCAKYTCVFRHQDQDSVFLH